MLFVQPDITPGTAAAEEVDTDGEDTAIVGGEVQSKPSAQAYRSRASSLSGSSRTEHHQKLIEAAILKASRLACESPFSAQATRRKVFGTVYNHPWINRRRSLGKTLQRISIRFWRISFYDYMDQPRSKSYKDRFAA